MGWLEKILGKLVDINLNLQSKQAGVLNIKTEKNTYNNPLIFTTPEAARAFGEGIAGANRTKSLEDAENLLSANSATLKVLPESKAAEYANAIIIGSVATVSGVQNDVRIGGEISFEGKVTAEILPKSQ